VNFYKHHIGDYAAATAHLSLIEDAIYSRMLRRYYLQEGPLPVPVEQVARLVGARGEEETVKALLLEFFVLADDGWHNKRADEEIAAANAQADANRRVAQEREARKRERENESSTNRPRIVHRDTEESCSLREPSQTPDSRLQTRANNPSGCLSADADPANCPHGEIIALYHELLPANPPVKVWGEDRAKLLRTRWREDPKRQSLDYWRRFFSHVAASEFLTGRRLDREGRPFLPGLDWLVRPTNFAKVIENRYHDRSAA
jgi:uncharacterized protein YdaU (DUF1376 family)